MAPKSQRLESKALLPQPRTVQGYSYVPLPITLTTTRFQPDRYCTTSARPCHCARSRDRMRLGTLDRPQGHPLENTPYERLPKGGSGLGGTGRAGGAGGVGGIDGPMVAETRATAAEAPALVLTTGD